MAGIVSKVVLLILMVTAFTGWLIFAAGFGIFAKILSTSTGPLPVTIGVSWTSVLSPMILFGASALPLYTAATIRIFLRNNSERVCSAIMVFLNFFYMLGMSTTLFILALLFIGGLGDYLKNVFMLKQINVMVMAIGCLLSVVPYWAHLVIWPLVHIRRNNSKYMYQELSQNAN